jgi:hypothetical protein
LAVLISGVVCAGFAATGSASPFVRCGTPQSGSVVSPHWAESGPEHVSISNQAAANIRRRIGPGVEGLRPTVADARCSVALSVAVTAAIAWATSPPPSFDVGVHIVGAGHHPYLGRFRCTILPAGRNATATCTHPPDRHAARIVVRFHLDRT